MLAFAVPLPQGKSCDTNAKPSMHRCQEDATVHCMKLCLKKKKKTSFSPEDSTKVLNKQGVGSTSFKGHHPLKTPSTNTSRWSCKDWSIHLRRWLHHPLLHLSCPQDLRRCHRTPHPAACCRLCTSAPDKWGSFVQDHDINLFFYVLKHLQNCTNLLRYM